VNVYNGTWKAYDGTSTAQWLLLKALTERTIYPVGIVTDAGMNDGVTEGANDQTDGYGGGKTVIVPCVVITSPDEITYKVVVLITTVTVLEGAFVMT
jgi:hypothetical protein